MAVACLLPGATDTEFASVGGTEAAMVFNLPLGLGRRLGVVLSGEAVAAAAFDGLAIGSASIVPGFANRAYAASTRLLPARASAAFSAAVFGQESPLASVPCLASTVHGIAHAAPATAPCAGQGCWAQGSAVMPQAAHRSKRWLPSRTCVQQ